MKHNNVFLCGWVSQPPTIIINEKTGEIVYTAGRINTIRGVRNYGTKTSKLSYDHPFIYTVNPEMVDAMKQWKRGDFVEVKGSMTTKNVNKTHCCPYCKHVNGTPGTIVYVHPIYMRVCGHEENEKEAAKQLKEFCEISNTATAIGVLCRDPQVYRTPRSTITSYQMAIRRKFRIAEDAQDLKTDFPWVKSYGKIGKNDALLLRKGSYIMLDGWVQSREFERTTVCEQCGQEFQWNDFTQEFVPYASEYMRNCKTPDEIQKEEEEALKRSVQAVFDENEIPTPTEIEGLQEIEGLLDEYNALVDQEESDEEDSSTAIPSDLSSLI